MLCEPMCYMRNGHVVGIDLIADKEFLHPLQTLKQSPIFSPDRLKGAKEIAAILKKGQKFYDYGGTLVRFGKFAHIGVLAGFVLFLTGIIGGF